ncbi:MAG: hypothetical protein M1820_006100 [Bogoriella megaspora]|nr:MAG: hypothetical protein M1820_006100 [Bogoriella megaspora]
MSNGRRAGPYPIQSPEYTINTSQPSSSSVAIESETPPDSIRATKDCKESIDYGRTIVVCLDGTGDKFDNDNSNVVHFVSCLKKHQSARQMTYYQSGIGTYDAGGLTNGIKAAMDMAVGSGLGVHIKDAYQFLMQNYRDGDKICLLGFSRGAYTVRCLAGMLHKVGLLPADNGSQVNFAYNFYKDDTPEGWKMSAEFKNTFCTDVNVYFVGVWDSVSSVGFIPRTLPFSKSPRNAISYFRHAMALDEHRAKFAVCPWQHYKSDYDPLNPSNDRPKAQVRRKESRLGKILNWFRVTWKTYIAKSNKQKPDQNGTVGNGIAQSHDRHSSHKKLVADFNAEDTAGKEHLKKKSDVLEVWFMGAHADVGGGAVANECRHMLSRIPLRWMIRQCFQCNTGIVFDTASLAEQGLDVHSLWPTYQPPEYPSLGPPPSLMEQYENGEELSRRHRSLLLTSKYKAAADESPGNQRLAFLSEANEDFFDALSSINDQLVQAKGWWILEFLPIKCHILTPDRNGWKKIVGMNLGRHRAIRQSEPNMHWTVKHMMEQKQYKVKGSCVRDTNWQVVT